ncbi:hypothetical protein GCM10010413_05500 [Promicromonospora sukumoe]
MSELERVTGADRSSQLPQRVGAYLSFAGCVIFAPLSALFDVPPLLVVVTVASVTVGPRTFEFILSDVKRAELLRGPGVGDSWRTLVLYGVLLGLITAQILLVRGASLWWAVLIALPVYLVEFLLARERLPDRFRSKQPSEERR